MIFLEAIINENNNFTLDDIKKDLLIDVSSSTVWKRFKKINFTFKIIIKITENRNSADVKEERIRYINGIQLFPSICPILT